MPDGLIIAINMRPVSGRSYCTASVRPCVLCGTVTQERNVVESSDVIGRVYVTTERSMFKVTRSAYHNPAAYVTWGIIARETIASTRCNYRIVQQSLS